MTQVWFFFSSFYFLQHLAITAVQTTDSLLWLVPVGRQKLWSQISNTSSKLLSPAPEHQKNTSAWEIPLSTISSYSGSSLSTNTAHKHQLWLTGSSRKKLTICKHWICNRTLVEERIFGDAGLNKIIGKTAHQKCLLDCSSPGEGSEGFTVQSAATNEILTPLHYQ